MCTLELSWDCCFLAWPTSSTGMFASSPANIVSSAIDFLGHQYCLVNGKYHLHMFVIVVSTRKHGLIDGHKHKVLLL